MSRPTQTFLERRKAIDHDLIRWRSFQDDYEKLCLKLLELPNSLTQKTNVPIGKYAYMEGNMVHTNEIMALLGEDYFVTVTASEAADIAKRRKDVIQDNISRLIQESEKLETDLQRTGISVPVSDDFVSPFNPYLLNEEGLPIKEVTEEIKDVDGIEQKSNRDPKVSKTVHGISVNDKPLSKRNSELDQLFATLGLEDTDREESEDDEKINDDDRPRMDMAEAPVPVAVSPLTSTSMSNSTSTQSKSIMRRCSSDGPIKQKRKSVSFANDIEEHVDVIEKTSEAQRTTTPTPPAPRASIMPDTIQEREPVAVTEPMSDLDRSLHAREIDVQYHKRRQQLLAQYKPPPSSERERLLKRGVVVDNVLAEPINQPLEDSSTGGAPPPSRVSKFRAGRLGRSDYDDDYDEDQDEEEHKEVFEEKSNVGGVVPNAPEIQRGPSRPKKVSKFKASRMASK